MFLDQISSFQLNPHDWTAHNNRGVIFKDSGLFNGAIQCYDLAIRYGDTNCVAKMNMAIVLTDLGTTLKLAGNVVEAVQKCVFMFVLFIYSFLNRTSLILELFAQFRCPIGHFMVSRTATGQPYPSKNAFVTSSAVESNMRIIQTIVVWQLTRQFDQRFYDRQLHFFGVVVVVWVVEA